MRLISISLLLLTIISIVSAATIKSGLVNKEVNRVVDIKTHVEEVAISIEIENEGTQPTDEYYLAIHPDKVPHLSYLSAFARDKKTRLEVKAVHVDSSSTSAPSNTSYYLVKLLRPLGAGQSVSISVIQLFTHTLVPLPAEILQSESQKVIYNDNHYFFSPYPTTTQTSSFRLASEHIESRSTDKKPNKANRDRVEYGPYKKTDAFKIAKLHIHFENNHPFVTFTDMRKDIEVSHWGNVAVEEHYVLKHTGARLKGSFSRFDYQRGRGQNGVSAFRTIRALLPEGARDVYYRDQIGNISSSNVREDDEGVLMELDPRFPLFGGWKTDFYIGYNVPSYYVLSYDTQNPKTHVLNISFSTPFLVAVVDKLKIRVILPEGATNIRPVTPFDVDELRTDTHFTYLDTVGRPVLVIEKSNLWRHHNQHFQVVYSFSNTDMIREPLMLVAGFFALFLASIFYMRMQLSISDDDDDISSTTSSS